MGIVKLCNMVTNSSLLYYRPSNGFPLAENWKKNNKVIILFQYTVNLTSRGVNYEATINRFDCNNSD